MFVHCHSHTEASIADGLFHPLKWVKAIKDRGFKAHALTDHGVMTYAIPFYHLMRENGLQPIIGCEFYYVDDPSIKDKTNRKSDHIVLIAKNYDGFRSLLKLQKLSFIEGFYFKQKIGKEWLRKYSEGLICSTACIGGVLGSVILGENPHKLFETYKDLSDIFGDDLYVEFQGNEYENQAKINKALYGLKSDKGFKQLVTNDCHYICEDDANIQLLLKKNMYHKKSDTAGESYTHGSSLWLKKPLDIIKSFQKNHSYLPKEFVLQGMKNTEEIAEKTKDFRLPEGKRYIPIFPSKIDSKIIFKAMITRALNKFLKSDKLKAPAIEYKKRLLKEYKVIHKYNLEDYFLIVWDLVRYAKKKEIFTGLGRGSAAGCLISYLLGIVKIDPLEYGLIFERFLNENRCESGELPDIDLDFESERREEIKDYIFEKYGRERVCEIGTYGRMKLKTCLIDFGKALELVTSKQILSITTKLESDNLEEAVEESKELKTLLVRNLDYAYAVEESIGQIKTQAIHPAGVVICSEPIENITPIKAQRKTGVKERIITTQSEDKYIIQQGLMKMDILGLKEYDIIKFVLENSDSPYTVDNYVEEIMNKESKKPNEEVWKMFQDGKTSGVFQFASSGMQALLQDMQPDCLNDLVAANALFRPGCLKNNWHTQYCRRKHGEERVRYVHKDVEKALSQTYGVIVFQEQFMEVIHKLGEISLVDSDTIRSALGKKNKEKLDKFSKQFIEGATGKIGEDQAKRLWSQIEKASEYSFNRAHSASYSVLAYISQYLKIKHTKPFWAAQFEWDARKNKREELLRHKSAAQDMGIKVKNPNINKSKTSFYIETEEDLYWSLTSIKGIGEKTAIEIEKHQPYKDFTNFWNRVNKTRVRVNNIENLIYSGALDEFGDRRELLHNYYILLEKNGKLKDKIIPSLTDEHMMLKFLEAMGFLEQKLKDIKDFDSDCLTEKELGLCLPKESVKVGGMLTEIKKITTKKGDPMGFATLIDQDESINLTFFPDSWRAFRSLIRESNIVQIDGVKSAWNNARNAVEVVGIEEIER